METCDFCGLENTYDRGSMQLKGQNKVLDTKKLMIGEQNITNAHPHMRHVERNISSLLQYPSERETQNPTK